ncbi:MAG: hypothetical protein M0P92_04840 [Acholeplasmataceae bacterium]|jgi:hypothetical protein|nr:hypothetical protein [Acholeplasmataceae bacterium]MCK9289589.1 hypothetical protein [Acholeplasmataceae bacterium]MCK9427994.1 hypothetical protein [Acholeplasmataceae bacterium]
MKKSFKGLMVVLTLALLMIFVGCDKTDNGGGGKFKTYVMEAEYIDLSQAVGAGMSSEASGVNMIWGNGESDVSKGWSSGYYIGFTYSAGLTLDFVFESSKVESATLILRLGSEIGDINFTPESLEVKLNDVKINYSNLLVFGSDMASMEFEDFTLASNLELLEGENVISITILDNTLRSGQIGGPMIDAIKVKTKAQLSWEEKLTNPEERGAI